MYSKMLWVYKVCFNSFSCGGQSVPEKVGSH